MAETIPKKRFEKIKKIGEGTYGSVSKVFDNKLKKIIAVKKIKFQDDQQTIPINALRQITCLKELNHPNIVNINYVTYDAHKKRLFIAFEYLEETLDEHMKRMGPLSPNSIKFILHQILQALRYLESRFYMHRDLKPQNIMITKQNRVKLIDFGQTKKISFQNFFKQKQTLEVSTLWYKAPELLLGHEYYNNKIQIWSLGCIFAEMAMGAPLFTSISQIEQVFKIFKLLGTPKIEQNKYLKQWEHFTPTMPKFSANQFEISLLGKDGNDLLRKMLTINPSERISITQCLNHSYFKGLF